MSFMTLIDKSGQADLKVVLTYQILDTHWAIEGANSGNN